MTICFRILDYKIIILYIIEIKGNKNKENFTQNAYSKQTEIVNQLPDSKVRQIIFLIKLIYKKQNVIKFFNASASIFEIDNYI